MSKVKLKCPVCNTEFERAKKEFNRSQKVGRKSYCSRNCTGIANKPNLGEYLGKGINPELWGKKWTEDQFTPFRYFLKCAKGRRHLKGDTNLDLHYLKDLWDEQQGICPLTGWNMILPKSSTRGFNSSKSPKNTSLDRVDNSLGYIKGNVRYVSVMANYCRNTFTDQEVKTFCEAVTNN
tara:strand:+ start:135 stop:671 length:537 start_codon:yes stop_codon:yes gene_type:complete